MIFRRLLVIYAIVCVALLLVVIYRFSAAQGYKMAGKSRLNEKDWSGAVTAYTRLIEMEPKNAEAFYNRGLARKNMREFDGALADLSRAIEVEPDSHEGY